MEATGREVIESIRQAVGALVDLFSEYAQAGGSYVTPGNRFMLLSLALMLDAKDILETGYNTGLTTLALGLSGANVTGVDNLFEQSAVEVFAQTRLANMPNVRLVQEDALLFLVESAPESYDLIFIDDCHWPSYTKHECVEIQRVLRPGGCAVFHDTFYAELWPVIEGVFPATWQRINLPSVQEWPRYSGVETMRGRDLGFGLVRKPWEHTPHAKSLLECMQGEKGNDGRDRPTMEVVATDAEGHQTHLHGETSDIIVSTYAKLLRDGIGLMPIDRENQESMRTLIRQWGKYCSACASFVGQERYGHRKSREGA